jgi:hypothetical protein
MKAAQELFTANVSKLCMIVQSQRKQLHAYLTWSICQHHDALTRILNARNNAQLSAHHHKTVLHFSCFLFYDLPNIIFILSIKYNAITTLIFFKYFFIVQRRER